MKKEDLEDMTTDQLVARFVVITLEQYTALLRSEHAKFNRLYDEMRAVEGALKHRQGDHRIELQRLFDHPNAQVRLQSAMAALAIAPEAARRTLQIISDRQEYPQAAEARGMLRALDDGSFIPS